MGMNCGQLPQDSPNQCEISVLGGRSQHSFFDTGMNTSHPHKHRCTPFSGDTAQRIVISKVRISHNMHQMAVFGEVPEGTVEFF